MLDWHEWFRYDAESLALYWEQAQNKQHPQRCSKTGRWKEKVE